MSVVGMVLMFYPSEAENCGNVDMLQIEVVFVSVKFVSNIDRRWDLMNSSIIFQCVD